MVILGGLEFVAAGYVLNELHKENKAEEARDRDRERRRRRRHHSKEDHHRPSRYDDSPPPRPSRPPHQQLYPPQQPVRPYSAPPPQNRPTMIPVAAVGAQMWHPPPQPQAYQGPPQSYGTWPLQQQVQQPPPQMQPQRPPQQWQAPPPQNNPNINFVPPPLQRPATMYPPPGVHIDMKTGKIQHDMYPPEMKRDRAGSSPSPPRRTDSGRQKYEGRQEYERVRENSMPSQFQPHADQGHAYSQPVIRPVSTNSAPPPRQGYAELDAETPGRYRPYGNEKANGFPARHYSSEDMDMRSPPPAYRA